MGERTVRVDLSMSYRLKAGGRTYGPGKGIQVPYELARRLGLAKDAAPVDTRIAVDTRAVRARSAEKSAKAPRASRSPQKPRPQAGRGKKSTKSSAAPPVKV